MHIQTYLIWLNAYYLLHSSMSNVCSQYIVAMTNASKPFFLSLNLSVLVHFVLLHIGSDFGGIEHKQSLQKNPLFFLIAALMNYNHLKWHKRKKIFKNLRKSAKLSNLLQCKQLQKYFCILNNNESSLKSKKILTNFLSLNAYFDRSLLIQCILYAYYFLSPSMNIVCSQYVIAMTNPSKLFSCSQPKCAY